MEPLQTNYNWNLPQRQSPAAIIIMLLQTAIRIIKAFWPILLIYFLRKQKDEVSIGIMWVALIFSVITIVATLLNYLFYKFYISNENFIIQSGWLKKKTLTIPLKNIQAVHLEQNVWQRFLKVTKVSLDSAGSEKVEVKIDALTISKAEGLKVQLLSQNGTEPEALEAALPARILRLSMSDLFKLSLSANHLEAFFILFGVGINLIEDVKKIFNIDGWEVMGDYAGQLAGQKIFAVSMLLILVALVSTIISVIRTTIKYYDFRLEDTRQGWKIFFGLITRQQMIVPFNKIQILSWRANWLRRKLDFWILNVQAIGHDDTKPKQHINVPVTRLEQAISLSASYQRSPVFAPADGAMINAARWKRRTLLISFPITAILFTLLYPVAGINAFWVLLLFPLMTWHNMAWHRNFRWTANEEGLQMYSGVWGRRYRLLTWKKIQQVQMDRSLYQEKHGLATLRFTTAGGKLSLFYIKYDLALQLMDHIVFYVESRNEGWM